MQDFLDLYNVVEMVQCGRMGITLSVSLYCNLKPLANLEVSRCNGIMRTFTY